MPTFQIMSIFFTCHQVNRDSWNFQCLSCAVPCLQAASFCLSMAWSTRASIVASCSSDRFSGSALSFFFSVCSSCYSLADKPGGSGWSKPCRRFRWKFRMIVSPSCVVKGRMSANYLSLVVHSFACASVNSMPNCEALDLIWFQPVNRELKCT